MSKNNWIAAMYSSLLVGMVAAVAQDNISRSHQELAAKEMAEQVIFDEDAVRRDVEEAAKKAKDAADKMERDAECKTVEECEIADYEFVRGDAEAYKDY